MSSSNLNIKRNNIEININKNFDYKIFSNEKQENFNKFLNKINSLLSFQNTTKFSIINSKSFENIICKINDFEIINNIKTFDKTFFQIFNENFLIKNIYNKTLERIAKININKIKKPLKNFSFEKSNLNMSLNNLEEQEKTTNMKKNNLPPINPLINHISHNHTKNRIQAKENIVYSETEFNKIKNNFKNIYSLINKNQIRNKFLLNLSDGNNEKYLYYQNIYNIVDDEVKKGFIFSKDKKCLSKGNRKFNSLLIKSNSGSGRLFFKNDDIV